VKDPRNKRLLNPDVWKVYPPIKPAIPCSVADDAIAKRFENVALSKLVNRQPSEPITPDECPY